MAGPDDDDEDDVIDEGQADTNRDARTMTMTEAMTTFNAAGLGVWNGALPPGSAGAACVSQSPREL